MDIGMELMNCLKRFFLEDVSRRAFVCFSLCIYSKDSGTIYRYIQDLSSDNIANPLTELPTLVCGDKDFAPMKERIETEESAVRVHLPEHGVIIFVPDITEEALRGKIEQAIEGLF